MYLFGQWPNSSFTRRIKTKNGWNYFPWLLRWENYNQDVSLWIGHLVLRINIRESLSLHNLNKWSWIFPTFLSHRSVSQCCRESYPGFYLFTKKPRLCVCSTLHMIFQVSNPWGLRIVLSHLRRVQLKKLLSEIAGFKVCCFLIDFVFLKFTSTQCLAKECVPLEVSS